MRIFVIAKRLMKQISGDKRSIGLMFIAPIFIIYLLYIILTSATTIPKIASVDSPASFIKVIETNAQIEQVNTEKEAIERIKDHSVDAYIKFSNNELKVVLEGTNPNISKLVLNVIQKAVSMQRLPSQLSATNPIVKPDISYYYGKEDMSSFDSLAPLLMGFLIFFFVFIIAGISFLRERISGTLERTLATPLRRGEIVLGYFLGFGIFVMIQTILIQVFMYYVLHIYTAGSFWLVLIINLLLATMALSLGTFLSAYARSEFQLFQFIPAIISPQILFSGIFDLSSAPKWVIVLSKIFPLTYGAEALRNVMIRGLGFLDVYKEMIVLAGYIAAFLILNTLALKKYRKI